MTFGKFRFETLLKIRENVRDEKKGELVTLQAELSTLEEKRQMLIQKIEEHLQEWKVAQQETHVTIEILINHQQYHSHLTGERALLEENIRLATGRVESKRIELDEAVREVKILENLREKKQIKEVELELRQTEKQMDELVSQEKTFHKNREEFNT